MCACTYAAVYQGDGLLGWVLAELLLFLSCSGESPYGLHLLAAVFLPHLVVVEGVLMATALRGFACPEDYFGGVGECPAAQVRGRVGLFPDYVVEQTEAVSE